MWVLKRCLRWADIIRQLYDFEQGVDDQISTVDGEDIDAMKVVLPSPKKELSLKPLTASASCSCVVSSTEIEQYHA